ncbi:VOC family protein [Streptomyces tricolor]|nr:VOC family protein [Streptomyces tricolor]
MADSPLQINALIVDAADPERLAAFWSALLGRPVVGRMGPLCGSSVRTAWALGFQRTGEPKTAKNRMHFDVTSPDPAAEQQRVEALGGRRLEEYDAGGFLVMADPEGNEFCIIPEGPFELDDEGRADYLRLTGLPVRAGQRVGAPCRRDGPSG